MRTLRSTPCTKKGRLLFVLPSPSPSAGPSPHVKRLPVLEIPAMHPRPATTRVGSVFFLRACTKVGSAVMPLVLDPIPSCKLASSPQV